MYQKIAVTITFLFLFIQSANSNENNFEIYKSKFNKIIKFIQKEKNDIKKYQKNEWIKVKNQNEKNLKKIDNKLSGFFHNLTTKLTK